MWIRLDDQFLTHPKALAAGKDGRALFIASLLYSGGQLTDGQIDRTQLPLIAVAAGVSRANRVAQTLVEVGLWHMTDGGWEIHDYHDHNPTSDEVRERREEVSKRRSDAGKRGAAARWGDGKRHGKPMANGMANDRQADANGGGKRMTPSPSPSLYPSSSPPLTHNKPAEQAGDGTPAEEEKPHNDPQDLALAAIDLMARADLLHAQEANSPIRQVDRWLIAARDSRHKAHFMDLLSMATDRPDADPADLAEELDPTTGHLDGGRARADAAWKRTRAARHDAEKRRADTHAWRQAADDLIEAMSPDDRADLERQATEATGATSGARHRIQMRLLALPPEEDLTA